MKTLMIIALAFSVSTAFAEGEDLKPECLEAVQTQLRNQGTVVKKVKKKKVEEEVDTAAG